MIMEVKNAFYHFAKQEDILKDINFSLRDGDTLCILGPNGVGKTTLIRAIIGMLKWSKGKTFLNGEDISRINTKKLWSLIAYIPQKRNFTFAYSGLEMVTLGLATHIGDFAKPGYKEIKQAEETMVQLDILSLADKDCSLMSGGELQMVLIARALVSKPKMIILDEPESGLDFRNQLKILALIKKLTREKGIICIMNTHYPNHALEIANKVLLLDYDHHYKLGKTDEILTADNIRQAFAVDVIIETINKADKNYKVILPTQVIKE